MIPANSSVQPSTRNVPMVPLPSAILVMIASSNLVRVNKDAPKTSGSVPMVPNSFAIPATTVSFLLVQRRTVLCCPALWIFVNATMVPFSIAILVMIASSPNARTMTVDFVPVLWIFGNVPTDLQ